MGKLFCNEFIMKQGFTSTEDYIQDCLDERIPARFDNAEHYRSLLGAGLIQEGFSIRTSNAGVVDCHYFVDSEGNLVGDAGNHPHSGREGVFSPEEVLSGERISSGWTIESGSFLGSVFRKWLAETK